MKVPFSLFNNDHKQGNQPDFRSVKRFPIVITEPGEYQVAGWKRTSKSGDPFIYCVLEKVEANPAPVPTREQNLAMLEQTRKALEEDKPIPPPPKPVPYQTHMKNPNLRNSLPLADYPPLPEDDDLPF